MNFTELLKAEVAYVYGMTEGLLKHVDGDNLDWKPETGDNWMTVGQLLMHQTTACGMCCKGFVTGDWGLPEGVKPDEMPAEAKMPQASEMPNVKSVEEAAKLLAEDKKLALQMIDQAGETDLNEKMVAAPWEPTPQPLGYQLLHMVGHLETHKSQLFYYLKMQGKPVNTMHMYGMS